MSQVTVRSESLFREAEHLIPGGVNSPVRAFTAVGGTPRFISRGEGSVVWDVDGNKYLDYVMSWGPLIHGHAYPPLVEAVSRAATDGTSFGAPTEREVDLARTIVRSMPTIEMVRFVSSGTEATMSAIRLARAYTRRDLIVKFAGNYHGHADMLLAQAGSGVLTFGVPSSPGVPEAATRATLAAQYNDIESIESIFSVRGGEIAAVIVEPIAGNMGVVPGDLEFLRTLRRLTSDSNSLLIFDEVISGFRVALGGAQSLFDIEPDITTLGKIVGGGLPIGAYGGRREIMEFLAPAGPVYQAGTLSGNPLATAAGLATLKGLKEPDFYAQLDGKTQRLAEGLRQAGASAGVPLTVNACTGMLTAFFADEPITDLRGAQRSDVATYGRFFHAMLDRGISLPPSQFEAWMLSSAHRPEDIDQTVELAYASLKASSA